MKKQDKQALHEKSVTELEAQLIELESELGKSKIEHSVGKLKSPASLKMLRKSISRIKSILSQKELSL
jgi:large subunit ribosomal protein L29